MMRRLGSHTAISTSGFIDAMACTSSADSRARPSDGLPRRGRSGIPIDGVAHVFLGELPHEFRVVWVVANCRVTSEERSSTETIPTITAVSAMAHRVSRDCRLMAAERLGDEDKFTRRAAGSPDRDAPAAASPSA